MEVMIILSAIIAVATSAPSGGYSNLPAPPSPAHIPTIALTPVNIIPVHTVTYTQPAYTKGVRTNPLITGTLQSIQDTYGAYRYSYNSNDGQSKTESRDVDGRVSGHFSYISPEGKEISLSYIADKDGFRPIGSHLPVPPELPPYLAQAYKESNDRLAQAYEESRLRGDDEFRDDGSYKSKVTPMSTVKSSYGYSMTVPATVLHHIPVNTNEMPSKEVPMSEYSGYLTPVSTPKSNDYAYATSAPAVLRPIQQQCTNGGEVSATTSSVSTPATPKKNGYNYIQYEKAVPEVPKPVQHSSTSYSTLIGGAPVVIPSVSIPAIPMKSGYEFTGYQQPAPEQPKPVQHSSTSYSTVVGGVPTFTSGISIPAVPAKSAYDYNNFKVPVPTPSVEVQPTSSPIHETESTENPGYGY